MEIYYSSNTVLNVSTNERLSENGSKITETSINSNPSSKKQPKKFNFFSRLVRVTEEDIMEKPRKTRHWKGRKAAERAKREEARRHAETHAQNSYKAVDFDDVEFLQNPLANIDKKNADFWSCKDYLSDIEEYLSTVPRVVFFGENRIDSADAQTTEILQRKIQEARELIMEEHKLFEKIDILRRKTENGKN